MKVKEKKLEDGYVQLNVTATAAEVAKAFNTAEEGFARKLGLQPNPNTTAAQAIADKLGITDTDSAIAPQAIETLIPYALDAKNIMPEANPTSEYDSPIARGKSFAFRVKVKLKPEYELKSYEPIEISVPAFKMDESLVDQRIAEMLQAYPEFTAVDPHPVQEGDSCFISMEASLDGEPVKNLCTDGRTLTLGQGYMPEDFERQVVGMEVGEEKNFDFDAPDYSSGPDPVTKKFSCTVRVLEIQEESYPELTDEWVQRSAPMYSSVEEMRSAVRASVEADARKAYDNQLESIAQAELAERFEGKISNEAYEMMAANLDRTLRIQLEQSGQDYKEFVEQQGGEQNFNMGLMMQVRQTLRAEYSLDALYRHEKLSISDDDINLACQEINPQNPMMVRREMEESGRGFALREVAQRYAATRYLIDNAKITYIEE